MSNVPDVPSLDRARLDLITGGDEALAREFLHGLIEEAQEVLDLIVGATASDDRTALAELAHRLKGMAAELGALRLRAAAAALETEDPEGQRIHVDAVRSALSELRMLEKS
jgi:HPt (histidine-containing phosphotransfer) domain-containing protein